MYSNLLDNILQNEKNLNVVIEKETNTGLVYKNNVEKFITMNIQDIIDKSMDKLNKHLKDFYKESLKDEEFIIMDKIFHEQIKNIENKYNDFKKNEEIKKKVEDFITQMYDNKKEKAIKNEVVIEKGRLIIDTYDTQDSFNEGGIIRINFRTTNRTKENRREQVFLDGENKLYFSEYPMKDLDGLNYYIRN